MTFKLSQKSLERLDGVDERLVNVCLRAIQLTTIDFGVTSGIRTAEEQHELYKRGASQCDGYKKLSYHQTGKAVDLMGWFQGRPTWEMKFYDDIGDAMIAAAKELDVPLRWGCAWHIKDARQFNGTCQQMMDEYIDIRRAANKRPFLDGPHWEIYE